MSLRKLLLQTAQIPRQFQLKRTMGQLSIPNSSQVNLLRVKGQLKASMLAIGSASICSAYIVYDKPGARVEIGDRTFIGTSSLIAADRISIGDDVLISWDVTIVDHESHNVDWDLRSKDVLNWHQGEKDWSHVRVSPISIGAKFWICFDAKVLGGVSIGEVTVV